MSKPLSGKDIIEQCRQCVEASTGEKATWATISAAIKASTQISLNRQYLFNLARHDRKPTEKYRAIFAQFLELPLEEIALHQPTASPSKAAASQSAKHRYIEFNQLARWFISRPLISAQFSRLKQD